VAPLTVSTGTVQIGTATTVGSATIGSVNFADATTLRMKAGVASDLLTVTGAGGFVNSGTTNLAVSQSGGLLSQWQLPADQLHRRESRHGHIQSVVRPRDRLAG
jgi:hypothetical protein